MTALAGHGDVEHVRCRMNGTRRNGDPAAGDADPHVEPENGLDTRIFENSLFDHGARPAGCFFSGLEEKDDAPFQFGLPLRQEHGRTQEHRRVGIVTAGMHQSRHERSIRGTCFFLELQRIHVGPQSHRGVPALPLKKADDTGPGNPLGRNLQGSQGFFDECRRFELLEPFLRTPVDRPPKPNEVFVKANGLLQEAVQESPTGHFSGKWQAQLRSPSNTEGGSISAQTGAANGHRVRNRHPEGRFMGLGISPSIRSFFRSRCLGSGIGTAETRKRV